MRKDASRGASPALSGLIAASDWIRCNCRVLAALIFAICDKQSALFDRQLNLG